MNNKIVVMDSVTNLPAKPDEIYGNYGEYQYKRLLKAYTLNPSAALQACSWGKFQIMGSNHSRAGYKDVFSFVKAMSISDTIHIAAFLRFAKNNDILMKGLRTRNYELIAAGHNGKSWRKINPEYASNIERYAKEYEEAV